MRKTPPFHSASNPRADIFHIVPSSRARSLARSRALPRLSLVHVRRAAVFLERAVFPPARRAVQVCALAAAHCGVCVADACVSAEELGLRI
jgi:hypothetical protein